MPNTGNWREFFSGHQAELDGGAEIEIEHWAANLLLKT